MLKPLTVWITANCKIFLMRWEYQNTLPASWETCMQDKKQWLELDILYPWDSPGKILEWAPISFSRGSSWLRDQIQVSYSAGRFFTNSQPIPNIWMWGSGAGGTGAQPPCLKGKTSKGLACRSYQPLTNLGCLISHRYSESLLHKLPEHLPLRVFFWGTQAKTAYKGFPVCF